MNGSYYLRFYLGTIISATIVSTFMRIFANMIGKQYLWYVYIYTAIIVLYTCFMAYFYRRIGIVCRGRHGKNV